MEADLLLDILWSEKSVINDEVPTRWKRRYPEFAL